MIKRIFIVSLFAFLSVAATTSPEGAKKEKTAFELQPGDRIEVVVYREEDLSGVYEVDPEGKLTFPLIGEIQVIGLQVEEFRQELSKLLKKYLIDPQVSISRAEGTIKSISILGQVEKPGTYDYMPGFTLMRLVSTAGGFAESANKKKIKIVRIVNGEKKVIIINSLDIIDGKTDDISIQPGDIIFVPESIF